jgi:hypothetical protein
MRTDYNETPAGFQNSKTLDQRMSGVRNMLQYLVHAHGGKTRIGKREPLDIGRDILDGFINLVGFKGSGMKVYSVSIQTLASEQPSAPAIAASYVENSPRALPHVLGDKLHISTVILTCLLDIAGKPSANQVGRMPINCLHGG